MKRIPDFSKAMRVDDENVEHIRSLTIAQRIQMFDGLCRAALELQRSRQQAHMEPSSPAPWPESTWEYLKKWTRHARATDSR